jgi:hypothetical protein
MSAAIDVARIAAGAGPRPAAADPAAVATNVDAAGQRAPVSGRSSERGRGFVTSETARRAALRTRRWGLAFPRIAPPGDELAQYLVEEAVMLRS